MTDEKRPAILLLGAEGALCRELERELARDFRVRSRRFVPLPPIEDLLDVQAALVVVEADHAEGLAELAETLKGVPVGAASVLLARSLSEDAIEAAVAELAPRHLLFDPVPAIALRHALRDVEGQHVGRGARDQHRPARALLGISSAIRRVTEHIERIAPSQMSVLVLGETGTGKELVARAIHERSPRASRAFVAVNCGALTETLLEAELFGHEKGAFTGATKDRRGLFEEADEGTLFLDEVGEMSPQLQVKLLRVLETGEVRPVGSNHSRRTRVRVVSATHRDLETEVEEGRFRQDLLYRLNAATIYLPPLRRRRVDIPFLAQHFAEELGREQARRIVLGEDFVEALAQRDLPGNVREVRNAVERAIALTEPGEAISSEALAPDASFRPALFAMGTLADRVAQLETQAIQEALQRFDGNKTHVAEALGISRAGLRQKMRRLGLD